MLVVNYTSPALDRLRDSVAAAETALNLIDASLAVLDGIIAGRPDYFCPACEASYCAAACKAIVKEEDGRSYMPMPCLFCDGWTIAQAIRISEVRDA